MGINEVERAIDGSFILVVLELSRKEKWAEPSPLLRRRGLSSPPPPDALIFSPSHMTTTLIKHEAKSWQRN